MGRPIGAAEQGGGDLIWGAVVVDGCLWTSLILRAGSVEFDRSMSGKSGEDAGQLAPGPRPPPLEWKFSQVFGERTAGEEVQEGKPFFRVLSLSGGSICRYLVCWNFFIFSSYCRPFFLRFLRNVGCILLFLHFYLDMYWILITFCESACLTLWTVRIFWGRISSR